MKSNASPKVYRTAPWMICLVVLGLVAFVAATWFMHRTQGFSLTTLSLAAGGVLTLIGLADVLTMRITLFPDTIEVFARFRRSRIARAEIAGISAEKGTPLMLELKTGGWVKLPDLGGSLHPNTVRAWLRPSPGQP